MTVRLAFAADAERGTALPFVLDEVLSSSDPVRFRDHRIVAGPGG